MINLIAAVGLYGEIGLNGGIPWLDDPNIENVTKADLGWFAKQTDGGVLVVGGRTWQEMRRQGFEPGSREVQCWIRDVHPQHFLETLEDMFPGRDIWICGGAKTYEAFMPFVQRFYISRIPWSGKADRYMPPIQQNWSYPGGPIRG